MNSLEEKFRRSQMKVEKKQKEIVDTLHDYMNTDKTWPDPKEKLQYYLLWVWNIIHKPKEIT